MVIPVVRNYIIDFYGHRDIAGIPIFRPMGSSHATYSEVSLLGELWLVLDI